LKGLAAKNCNFFRRGQLFDPGRKELNARRKELKTQHNEMKVRRKEIKI
jgi:hypothetical protein